MPSLEWRLISITPRTSYSDDVASIWRPVGAPRYAALGDVLRKGCEPPVQPVTMYLNCPSVEPGRQSMLEHPVHYLLVWRELAGGGLTVWRAQPPQGYRALGCVASRGLDPPPRTAMVCVREVRWAPSAAMLACMLQHSAALSPPFTCFGRMCHHRSRLQPKHCQGDRGIWCMCRH
jgi:Vacuolar protein sorting-associated protein 62